MHPDTALSLAPLSPLPRRPACRPAEVFPAWLPAQRIAGRHATRPLPSIAALRASGFLPHARAERIAEWYTGRPVANAREVKVAYEALADEVTALARAVTAPPAGGGLGVWVTLVTTPDEPYVDAAALCDDLRQRVTMKLRAASADAPHPLLSNATVDRLRTVHDVLGHAALGLGGS